MEEILRIISSHAPREMPAALDDSSDLSWPTLNEKPDPYSILLETNDKCDDMWNVIVEENGIPKCLYEMFVLSICLHEHKKFEEVYSDVNTLYSLLKIGLSISKVEDIVSKTHNVRDLYNHLDRMKINNRQFRRWFANSIA